MSTVAVPELNLLLIFGNPVCLLYLSLRLPDALSHCLITLTFIKAKINNKDLYSNKSTCPAARRLICQTDGALMWSFNSKVFYRKLRWEVCNKTGPKYTTSWAHRGYFFRLYFLYRLSATVCVYLSHPITPFSHMSSTRAETEPMTPGYERL